MYLKCLCYLWIFKFFQVKSHAKVLDEARAIKLQLASGEYYVIFTAHVRARKRSSARLVDAGLDSLRREYEIVLVVFLSAWSMQSRCSVRLMWVQTGGQCCRPSYAQFAYFGFDDKLSNQSRFKVLIDR
ncbi:hypothetical protein DPMN_120952 [Dreissena polymorpha]|uniref:Hexosyltransferase n=1 Tax=Dreissena polymorpha TaxID=45954 RepID=A0A9D4GLV2_DREPO|nr:hypothetical protein DPMN_120952 [Dreissena polymorpha]